MWTAFPSSEYYGGSVALHLAARRAIPHSRGAGRVERDVGASFAPLNGAAQDISYPAMADRMQAAVKVLLKDPAIASVGSSIGPGGSTVTLNQGRLFIALKPRDQRDANADQVINRLQGPLSKIEGITLYMQAAQDITVGARLAKTQYQYTLTDADSNELNHWAAIFLEKLRALPQITDVASDQENAGPRLNVTVNREVASSFGILPATVDNALDDAFGQRIVSTIFTPLNQYHVVLEVDPRFQTGPEALSNIYLPSSAGQQVPLSTLTKSEVTAAPIVVNHQGLFPSTTISFNLKPGVALGDAVNAIRQIEQQSGKPASLVTTFQGNANAFLSALSGEVLLIAAALVVIYIILGVLYESLVPSELDRICRSAAAMGPSGSKTPSEQPPSVTAPVRAMASRAYRISDLVWAE